MKLSFITTVFNEEKTIESFLDSLLSQTLVPHEIIIVDGNSTDQTVKKIKDYRSQFEDKKIKYTFNVKKGNRSIGRNYAIAQSTGDIILCSDSGCILDKNWIKYLASSFSNNSVDVVSGFYKPVTKTVFEKCLATYTCVMPDEIDINNFLPSSRSIAFKKHAWEKVKGYPEYLDTCEDLIFAKKMKKTGWKFLFEINAFVYWPQRKNIFQAFVQFYSYAKGDGLAHFFRRQTPLLYLRYFVGCIILFTSLIYQSVTGYLFVVFGLCFYIFWAIIKNYRYVNHVKAIFWLPALQFTADIAVLMGTTIGYIKSLNSHVTD